jgi:Flp pilus assembly pilin Flp
MATANRELGALALRRVKSFLGDETGATALEYALLAALIAIVITAALSGLANAQDAIWTLLKTAVEGLVP